MLHNPNPSSSWAEKALNANSALDQKGWPDNRVEAWKFTSLAHLGAQKFDPAKPGSTDLKTFSEIDGYVIAITDGQLNNSRLPELPDGMKIIDISDDDQRRSEIYHHIQEGHFLAHLSAARQTMAISIEIDKGIKLVKPLILHFSGGKSDQASYPFIAVRLADGAQAAIAEIHQSEMGLACPLFVYDIGDEARLDHIRVQDESRQTTHLGLNHMSLGLRAFVNSFALSKGGQLARLETHNRFNATQAELAQSAIYLGQDNQHHDITSFVAHEKSHCASRQLIRGVLDDKARGVFQGKVRVAPDAQKTDGQQMSRALLLSRDAEADAKPELEIFADDVVCAHGATVGELDEHLLFYLKSRGIDTEQARNMLIDAFLLDTLEEVSIPAFADYLQRRITDWQMR
jgi:Fe-S cluster assembly protein SufD